LCLSDPDEDRYIPYYRLWVEEFNRRWEWYSCVDQDSFTKNGATGVAFSLGFVWSEVKPVATDVERVAVSKN